MRYGGYIVRISVRFRAPRTSTRHAILQIRLSSSSNIVFCDMRGAPSGSASIRRANPSWKDSIIPSNAVE